MTEKIIDGVLAVVVVVLAFLIFSLGLKLGISSGETKLARLETQHAADKARADGAALFRLAAANSRADQLTAQLAAAESARQSLALEKDRELRRLTTGRPCLAGAAVRLLNLPDGARLKPGAVSETTGSGTGDDAGFASDTDVAEWASLCRRSYDTCRGRLQAIADFYLPEEDAPEAASE